MPSFYFIFAGILAIIITLSATILHPMYKIERYDHATEYSNYRVHRHHYQLSTKLICCSLALVATKHLQLPLELPPDLAVGNHQINGVT